jgi:hypothetical protein
MRRREPSPEGAARPDGYQHTALDPEFLMAGTVASVETGYGATTWDIIQTSATLRSDVFRRERSMPRVVPTQIVDFLNRTLSRPSLNSAEIATVIDLVNELPSEFLIISGDDYSSYRMSINAIANLIDAWGAGRGNAPREVEAKEGLNNIRHLLSKCPDQIPAPETTELIFISDVDLRESIRNDISTANQAYVDGLWKAATVLAGSAAEALLLWAITEKKSSPDVETARAAITPSPTENPDRWNLGDYIKVAEQLRLVNATTAKQADLAREFRNLIHPGRANRLAKACNRGTALLALAAVEHIVEDLSKPLT